ncbi:hypothetical protein BT96DRAFT_1033001 [Gymnopus androsaceus JB14]|uniref:Uncharacterized protein n=1 Tax=Gymnopus androsaceus JB14 TaxID=1447944 RepID=A0A6A4GD62_9AGAR|nr:hypothetical protein BT96DRAFT_1033001 [Gymnopus androsaceus JB14]
MDNETLGRLLSHMHQNGQLTPALLGQIMGSSASIAAPTVSALPPAQSLIPNLGPTLSSSPAPAPISTVLNTLASLSPSSAGSTPLPTSQLSLFSSSPTSAPATPYNSMNMLQSVAHGSSSMPAFGGFGATMGQRSGLSNLVSQRLNTSRSDRTRRDHANATLPKKARSKAIRKPSLMDGYQEPKVEDCLDTGALPNGQSVSVINLSLQGRLHFPSKNERMEYKLPANMVHYTRQEESFLNLNDRLGLNIELSMLPLNTPIRTLLTHVAQEIKKHGLVLLSLQDVGMQSSFVSSASLLPLQLLSFTNMGRSNSASQTPRLQTAIIRADSTVHDLLTTYKREFVVKAAITNRRFFVINFAVKDRHQIPTAVKISLSEFGLGTELVKRNHTCLPIRTYATFREDYDALLPDGYEELFLEEGPDGEAVDTLCDEQECMVIDEDDIMRPIQDEEDTRDVEQALVQATLPAAQPLMASDPIMYSLSTSNATAGQSGHSMALRHHTTQVHVDSDLPAGVPIASLPYGGSVLCKKAYLQSNPEEVDTPPLHLIAPDLQSLVHLFIAEVRAANFASDFTLLLAPNRHFMIDSITSGAGVESEVIHAAYKHYTDEASKWFCVSAGDFSTISTIATAVNEHVSQKRLEDLADLGSLVALNLIHGYPTLPLNPLLLNKVSKWFPGLAHLLSTWLNMTPEDPLDANIFASQLAAYHDLQLPTLSQRDTETHRVMAFRMLQNAVVGKLGVQCQELDAFLKGFRLPVPGGLTFCEIARSYLRGATAFVSKVYNFVETFQDLSAMLDIKLDDLKLGDETRLSNVLASAPQPYRGRTFEFILQDFLESTGIPCPTRFEPIRGGISPVVSLTEAEDSSTFRLRSFTWAVGGAPFLRVGSRMSLEVILVSDDDRSYISNRSDERLRAEFLQNGVCSYKTCFQEMRIPVSYLISLLEATYSGETEPRNARDAIHFWLFRQILEAIGSHTFV